MSKKSVPQTRRRFTDEFKREAVQMLLDGHSALSVAEKPSGPSREACFCESGWRPHVPGLCPRPRDFLRHRLASK